jgi:hypothetical protein
MKSLIVSLVSFKKDNTRSKHSYLTQFGLPKKPDFHFTFLFFTMSFNVENKFSYFISSTLNEMFPEDKGFMLSI